MHPLKLTPIAFLSSCLLTGVLGTAAGGMFGDPARPNDELALQQLQTDFHGAGAHGDTELMRSIWTEDAVFSGGGQIIRGRDNIVDFLSADPTVWGATANAAPTYKTITEIHGDTAFTRFECIIIRVTGSSPLTTPLSSLPPGSQNPSVEIIQHSNASIVAVKQRGKWLIQSFTGQGGAIQP